MPDYFTCPECDDPVDSNGELCVDCKVFSPQSFQDKKSPKKEPFPDTEGIKMREIL